MKSSYKIGTIYGIPIRVHITLLIFLPIIVLQVMRVLGIASIFWSVLLAVGLFASVALHELGHSVVAIRKGVRVRQILLLPIGGVAQLEHMPTRPRDEFHIAIAGPAVSLLLSVIGWAGGLAVWSAGLHSLGHVLQYLGAINLGLVVFNLLPSFPMDGGRVFRAWMTPRLGRLEATRIAAKTGKVMAIIFGIVAILPPLNIFLLAIAFFIHSAAGAEYRMVQVQDRFARRPTGTWGAPLPRETPYDDEVDVGPPPYARQKSRMTERAVRAQRNLFEDLLDHWR